jgi:ATP-dependent DNA helicase RecG
MSQNFTTLLDEFRTLPNETEWLEFKQNNYQHELIGKYISGLANSACIRHKDFAYLIFGIHDETHNVTGTSFRPSNEREGSQTLEFWLNQNVSPKLHFEIHEITYENQSVVIFKIPSAFNHPVKFKGIGYIRVGSSLTDLKNYPDKERLIWKSHIDWSAQICEGATINDLEPKAIEKARTEYKNKFPKLANEIDSWDDITFLNKAKVTISGKITNTAIIILGKDESGHFLSPSVAQISWILKDEHNMERDYEHFGPPFILNTDPVLEKIRNLKYRYLRSGTLFPTEINQYDPFVIREALNNCIAHQDYELQGRINVVEKPEELFFTNLGSFIPESIENVIEHNAPQEYNRNIFLTQAMFNLGMIDSIGSGIKKMFMIQRKRFFPMPDYDFSQPNRVVLRITGKVIDMNYTQALIDNTDLDLMTVIYLDKVQKKKKLSQEEYKVLKNKKLVEGRNPNLFVSSHVAEITEDKANYIKYRAFDDEHYKKMIISFIKEFGSASREDINRLIFDKLSDALDEKQKLNKIRNLLQEISKKDKAIKNIGNLKFPKWVILE